MASLERPPRQLNTSNSFAESTDRTPSVKSMGDSADKPLGAGRRTLGLILLGFVIFSWTATNFLASAILADNSFGQPFFVTYVNALFFTLPLGPALVRRAYKYPDDWRDWKDDCKVRLGELRRWVGGREVHGRHRSRRDSNDARESLLPARIMASAHAPGSAGHLSKPRSHELISIRDTAKLSLEFCFLWFTANYFLLTCLQYTTVASSTIITSTASGFTLVFAALMKVEKFTLRKLLSVLLCFVGITLVSSVDFSGKSSDDEHRGQFPEKTLRELTIGNTLALLSAIVYAVYITNMKKRIPDESKVSMPIFFGLVGLFNGLFLWPAFFILDWVGLEAFNMPPPGRVTWILLINGFGSMLADVAWAYAVLFTSPILVTVGLSMTIPLTLVGQMVLSGQTSTGLYWLGACVVVLSFVVINQEGMKEDEQLGQQEMG